jgi:hypothetical protein
MADFAKCRNGFNRNLIADVGHPDSTKGISFYLYLNRKSVAALFYDAGMREPTNKCVIYLGTDMTEDMRKTRLIASLIHEYLCYIRQCL